MKHHLKVNNITLPPSTPQLAFVVLGLTRRSRWVSPPTAQLATDFAGLYTDVSTYQEPLPMGMAILEGLILWLGIVLATVNIVSWDANFDAANADRVTLRLHNGDHDMGHIEFDLRLHLLGQHGVLRLLTWLSGCRPRLGAVSIGH